METGNFKENIENKQEEIKENQSKDKEEIEEKKRKKYKIGQEGAEYMIETIKRNENIENSIKEIQTELKSKNKNKNSKYKGDQYL
jgi:hypothetical protein